MHAGVHTETNSKEDCVFRREKDVFTNLHDMVITQRNSYARLLSDTNISDKN